MVYPITVHCLVCNEDRWLWFSLKSILPWVQKVFIYDTGSTDLTVKIIESFADTKIEFKRQGPQTAAGLTVLRNEMVAKTKTDWFMLVDGDEVWNQKKLDSFLRFTLDQPKTVEGVFLRTRNCVGDVWHYLDDSFGKYHLAGKTGHLNIRAYRVGHKWQGIYPLESYGEINNQPEKLCFFDGFYWHMTNLQRSSQDNKVLGFRHRTIARGLMVKKDELPEVFFWPRPNFVADPLIKQSWSFKFLAKIRSLL